MLVDGSQLKQYENSSNSRMAQKYFGQLQRKEELVVTPGVFVCMRDHLFVQIHFGNGSRSGVTANMTVPEFSNGRMENEFYIVHVRKHKTYHVNGPAMVTFTIKQYEWMELFLLHVRSFGSPTVNNFFVASTGSPMNSGQINNQLHSLWVKAGILDEAGKRLCGNLVRKSVVTGVRDQELGNFQEVADTMSHSLKTAEMHYHLRQKEKLAVVAGQTIRQLYATPSKKIWSAEEVSVLEESIPLYTTTSSDVREICSTSGLCTALNASPKQILNKVHSIRRYSPRKPWVSFIFVSVVNFTLFGDFFLNNNLKIYLYMCLQYENNYYRKPSFILCSNANSKTTTLKCKIHVDATNLKR